MNASVDDDFARFGNKSYAINKINSVEVRESQPHGFGGALICGSIAALCLIGWIGKMQSSEPVTSGPVVAAVIFGALAYWQWRRAQLREYRLFLMTSSSETQAIVSRDPAEIASLRDRIEAAMLHHSRGRTDR